MTGVKEIIDKSKLSLTLDLSITGNVNFDQNFENNLLLFSNDELVNDYSSKEEFLI